MTFRDMAFSFIAQHQLKVELEYGTVAEPPYESVAVWDSPKKLNEARTVLADMKS